MEAPLGLDDLLKFMTKKGASDLHLKPTRPPLLRIGGKLMPIKSIPLKPKDIEEMVLPLLTEAQRRKFEELQSVDIGYGVAGVARFRCNVYQQRGSVAAVFRRVPFEIKNYEELNLPDVVATFADFPAGLVLVTGPTGSGKSTTLAAIVQDIIRKRPCHVVTIEDPIEFLHRDKKSIINQREVDVDTRSFSVAMRSALRQDPDVILVGEMRDYETIETALLAAETGHLVLSTLHTLDATETINRIITVFPPHQQKQIRIQLAAVLKSVISMRLLPRADGLGRVPAVEVLISTAYIRDCIEQKEKTKLIRDAIAQGTSQYSMQTFDQSLYMLYKQGLITLEEALRRATNPDELRLRIQGIQSTADISREEMEGALEGPAEADLLAASSPFEFGGRDGA